MIGIFMIGDWIYDENRKIIREVEPEDFYLGNTVYFKPILLTPEILEKNGFKSIYQNEKSAYKWKEYEEDDNYQSIIIDLEVNVASGVWNEKSRMSYKGRILYVHELQQAMRLCKINKTIEL